MSENPNNVNSSQDNLDDEFKQFAQQTAQDEADRKNRAGFTYEFENIKWTGLHKAEKGKRHIKVIRALGGVPNTNKTPYDARTVRVAEIICDDKKKRFFKFPHYEENKAYLFWRIINHVLEVQWGEDKKKIFVHETAHPQIFQMVKNNSFPIGSMQQKTTYGWSGRDMFVMNCIDRSMYKWHQENKHSALLSKEIRNWVSPDGKEIEFATQGIPAYGFVQTIAAELFAFYGWWGKYDIAIERTGTMNAPYRIVNCEKNPEKLTDEVKKLVVIGPLTEEELSWECYDLSKLFKVTSYTKWWNNLKSSIAAIDTALGTHYYTELKSLVDQEKVEREARKQAGEDVDSSEDNEAGVDDKSAEDDSDATPTIETRTPPQANNQAQVHCIDKLPPQLKEQIETFGFDAAGKFFIKYKGNETTVGCTVCGVPSPKSFSQCPKCGVLF